MGQRSHELREGHVGVPRHGAIAFLLKCQVLLEMLVQMLFQRLVPYETHSADSATEFDAFEDFSLSQDGRSTKQKVVRF